MKVACSSCHTQYTIADEKVPPQGARIRCRKCQTVFAIPGPEAAAAVPARVPEAPARSPQAPFRAPEAAVVPEPPTPVPLPTIPPAAPTPPAGIDRPIPYGTEAPAEAAAPAPVGSAVGVAVGTDAAGRAASPAPGPSSLRGRSASPVPEGLPPEVRAKHERARRLARVLASDIAIYNKEKQERGLRDGNLVAVLGYEIKKSWEVYKERVTPDLANSTPYFRDALNDMLAEGKKVF